jgi:ketosteroid isomerase-like protein
MRPTVTTSYPARSRRYVRSATAAAVLGAVSLVTATRLIAALGEDRFSEHAMAAVSTKHQGTADSAAVAATVDRFHKAVTAGDSTLALSLLASDVVVLESGGMETRDEFRARHLAADIAFAQAVKSERGQMRVTVRGDVAWATSTSTSTGEYRGREVNSSGAELMVLSRTPEGWRISAIHWSSRARRPASG